MNNKSEDLDSAQQEALREHAYYENLHRQSLENMPPIKHYKVIRSHLKNMQVADEVETIFVPLAYTADEIIKTREKATEFADNLLSELQSAREQGYVQFSVLNESIDEMTSLQDKVVVSVQVNIIYQKLFTVVDMLDYEITQSEEDMIYVPQVTASDLEEMKEALYREAYSFKVNYS